MSLQAECPECAAAVEFPEDALTGEIVSCGECGVELEITRLDPPTVEPAPEEEEDWGE